MPALNEPQAISRLNDKGVESLKCIPGQVITRFGKAPIRYATMKVAVFTQAAKEGIEHDLLRGASHGQQRTDQAWQGQFA
jgi:hypothetical protein